jgi:hypothetical protein
MKLLIPLFALIALCGCVAPGRPAVAVFPSVIEEGVWYNSPEPTENQMIAHGYKGKDVWELSDRHLSALFGPTVYGWSISDDRPINPTWVRPASVISSFTIGRQDIEQELRTIHAKRWNRFAWWLLDTFPSFNGGGGS